LDDDCEPTHTPNVKRQRSSRGTHGGQRRRERPR